VIVNYVVAEQQRKTSSLKIGIFTVFLVTTIITMMVSVTDITPILFVKMGQENAGAIDMQLTFMQSNLVSGDVNFYTVDPFAGGNTSFIPLVGQSRFKKRSVKQAAVPSFQVSGDSLGINGAITLLNFTWYNNTLFGLTQYEGFTPRTLYPNSIVGTNSTNTTNLMMIADCLQE
jgi:hypothetical protein